MNLQLKIAFLFFIALFFATSADDNVSERVSLGNPNPNTSYSLWFLFNYGAPYRILSVGEYEVKNKEVIDLYNWAYKNYSKKYLLLDKYTPYDNEYKLYIKLLATSSSLILKTKKVYNKPAKKEDLKLPDEFKEEILLSSASKIRFNEIKKEFYVNDKSDEDNAVVGISWSGAFKYCYFLNVKNKYLYDIEDTDGRKYNCHAYELGWDHYYYSNSLPSYRLPTEDEWLKYAKASQNFSGSNTVSDVAWYKYNSDRKLRTGKQKKAHKQLFDLTGNGWEWCFDNYYAFDHKNYNRKYKVARGGSWGFTEETCSFKGNRRGFPPYKTREDIGFRIVTYIYHPIYKFKQPEE